MGGVCQPGGLSLDGELSPTPGAPSIALTHCPDRHQPTIHPCIHASTTMSLATASDLDLSCATAQALGQALLLRPELQMASSLLERQLAVALDGWLMAQMEPAS